MATRASRPRLRAAATMSAEASTPTTDSAAGNDFLRQHAVAASEVENTLAGLGLEQIEHWLSERRNEMGVLRIALGLPILCRR